MVVGRVGGAGELDTDVDDDIGGARRGELGGSEVGNAGAIQGHWLRQALQLARWWRGYIGGGEGGTQPARKAAEWVRGSVNSTC